MKMSSETKATFTKHRTVYILWRGHLLKFGTDCLFDFGRVKHISLWEESSISLAAHMRVVTLQQK